MRAKAYLTLHRGLLAVALYESRYPCRMKQAGGWSVPLASVLENSARPGEMTISAVSSASAPDADAVIEGELGTSATPVCAIRKSLRT